MIRTSLGALAARHRRPGGRCRAAGTARRGGGAVGQRHPSFQQSWGTPGSQLRVTITPSNYGGVGQVVETLPDGFTFVWDGQVATEEQTVRFSLVGALYTS